MYIFLYPSRARARTLSLSLSLPVSMLKRQVMLSQHLLSIATRWQGFYVYIYVYMYVCIHMYICLHMCIDIVKLYIHLYLDV